MALAECLAALRREQGLTQQALAERVRIHITLIRRCEASKTQPGIDGLRRTAHGLSVSSDVLLLDPEERGPSDDLRLQFEVASQFDDEERKILKASSRASTSTTTPNAGPPSADCGEAE